MSVCGSNLTKLMTMNGDNYIPTAGLKVWCCLVAQRMKFRQRIAWLAIIAYLAATCGLFFYIFEINDTYNKYAIDHYTQFHPRPFFLVEQQQKQKKSATMANKNDAHTVKAMVWPQVFSHLTDIPLSIWLLLLLLPYLQVFFMLLACTKADPRQSLAMLWPGMFYLKVCHPENSFVKGRKRTKTKKTEELVFSNGNNVFHT